MLRTIVSNGITYTVEYDYFGGSRLHLHRVWHNDVLVFGGSITLPPKQFEEIADTIHSLELNDAAKKELIDLDKTLGEPSNFFEGDDDD